jgi:hypothetical protein
METIMTPSIVKNVVRIPRQRTKQVRTRISYMTPEQLDPFLRAANECGPREHAVKGNSLFDEKGALKAWLAVRKPSAAVSKD